MQRIHKVTGLLIAATIGVTHSIVLAYYVWPWIREHSPLVSWVVSSLVSGKEHIRWAFPDGPPFEMVQAVILPADMLTNAILWFPAALVIGMVGRQWEFYRIIVVTFTATLTALYIFLAEFKDPVLSGLYEFFSEAIIFNIPTVLAGPIGAYLLVRFLRRMLVPNTSFKADVPDGPRP